MASLRQVIIRFDDSYNTYNSNTSPQYCSNRITTAKYSYSSFFPKFFYEQFRRYSNIFFTFIALFQQIPDVSPTGRYTTAVPLLCIFGVSAVKELFEDMKRHKADRKINENQISVLNKQTLEWDLKRWQDVRVGDILKCYNDSFFPSDMLLLSSSESNGMCYIETANLDGETNLKIRQSLQCTANCSTTRELKYNISSSSIECDPPNPRLYEFEGRLILDKGVSSYPLGPDNILLRGAKLKNTKWVQGVVLYTGHESKLMINSMDKTPIKQSRLEKSTNIQILWLLFILFATGLLSAIFSKVWAHGHIDFMKAFILADRSELQLSFAMTFLTFVILYNNLVPISLQVSLEVVRTFQAHFINSDLEMYDESSDSFAMARTSNLNEELGQVSYILSDKTGTLTRNVMTFKKCSVKGKIYDEASFNILAESARSDHQCLIGTSKPNDLDQNSASCSAGDKIGQAEAVNEFLTLLAICHTVVPQRDQEPNLSINNRKGKSEDEPDRAPCTSATKNHILSFSKHKNRHKQATKSHTIINNNHNNNRVPESVGEELEITPIDSSADFDLTEKDIALTSNNSSHSSNIQYHAASPDEGALVRGAQNIGFEFTNRTPRHVFVSKFGTECQYELLHVFEFDSFRKRMSVIVRDSSGNIKIYTKGADFVILERLASTNMIEETKQHLEQFALQGFRTLCCAYAHIDPHSYESWLKRYNEANLCYGDEKQKKLEACQDELENDLILLGSTAIEDKLQDDVPETIDTLLKAGINFWLLTGDKQETAINIGYSCKLLSRQMPLLIINHDTYDKTRDQILSARTNEHSALVIDGKSLQFALMETDITECFMRLALECKSVICCRVSPKQKAIMVKLVNQMTGLVTLAIGDGANDVAMIKQANVGVGISGNEGLQAAHSADYTITQFKFLARLLLVHGSWSMSRLRQMILYSFYKNIALYVVEFWFAIVSAWSGQTIFERWTIGLYNVIFTAAPPFAIGVFDRRCPADTMMKYPQLYKIHRANQNSNILSFWAWIATAFWHSLLLFWMTYCLIDHDTLWSNGLSDGGYLVFGNMLYTYVVITVCLKAGLEMHSWTILTHLAIWCSILSWFSFLMIYSRLWPTFPIAPDMVSIDELIFGSWVFWLGLAIVPLTAIMGDVVYKVIRKTCNRTLADELVDRKGRPTNSSLIVLNGLQTNISRVIPENKTGLIEVATLDIIDLDSCLCMNPNHPSPSGASHDELIGPLLSRKVEQKKNYSSIIKGD